MHDHQGFVQHVGRIADYMIERVEEMSLEELLNLDLRAQRMFRNPIKKNKKIRRRF